LDEARDDDIREEITLNKTERGRGRQYRRACERGLAEIAGLLAAVLVGRNTRWLRCVARIGAPMVKPDIEVSDLDVSCRRNVLRVNVHLDNEAIDGDSQHAEER
jgi:hypothetical protein